MTDEKLVRLMQRSRRVYITSQCPGYRSTEALGYWRRGTEDAKAPRIWGTDAQSLKVLKAMEHRGTEGTEATDAGEHLSTKGTKALERRSSEDLRVPRTSRRRHWGTQEPSTEGFKHQGTCPKRTGINYEGLPGPWGLTGEGHYGPEGTDGPADCCRSNRSSASACPSTSPVSPKGVQNELESSARMAEEEDVLAVVVFWNEDSFPTEIEEGQEHTLFTEAEPSSEFASKASTPPFELHVNLFCRSLGRQHLSHAGPCSGCRL
ncbi:UNVERIFIED_CONTAM: hypothetical protein FKN15_062427 [Acipenser sinensis]